MDLSNRFRLLVNEVGVVKSAQPLPKLPVARGRVGVPALLHDCLRGMDLCRRGTPTGFSYAVTTTVHGRLCGNRRLRTGGDRWRD
jgi:L-arabinose isomerase